MTAFYYALLVAAAAVAGPPPLDATLDALISLAALLLAALAALGRIWCSLFIAGRKDTELVTDGPYALCRHPLYVLSLLGGLALGLATRSLTLTAVTLIVLALLLGHAARAEERWLSARHGAAFNAYAARVPRWWPRWRDWQLQDALSVNPRLVWKAFVDAGAFLLLYALVNLARTLRGTGAWETVVLP